MKGERGTRGSERGSNREGGRGQGARSREQGGGGKEFRAEGRMSNDE